MRGLRSGKLVLLEVAPAAVAAHEKALTEGLPPHVRARIRVRGTEAAERAGCIALRTTRKGVRVGLYLSAEGGLETDPEHPYSTVCEMHGTLVCHETRRSAERCLSHPDMWCDECRDQGKPPIAWGRIERLMLRSFTGDRITDTEQADLEDAFARDRARYAELSRTVRATEIEARKRMFL